MALESVGAGLYDAFKPREAWSGRVQSSALLPKRHGRSHVVKTRCRAAGQVLYQKTSFVRRQSASTALAMYMQGSCSSAADSGPSEVCLMCLVLGECHHCLSNQSHSDNAKHSLHPDDLCDPRMPSRYKESRQRRDSRMNIILNAKLLCCEDFLVTFVQSLPSPTAPTSSSIWPCDADIPKSLQIVPRVSS